MKNFLILIFAFASLFASAQNTPVKVLASKVTDSTTVTNLSGYGQLYYNAQSNKWRVRENGTWKDLTTTGGGGGEPLFTAFKSDLDLLAGIIVGDGLGTYSSITDNSANWDAAFGWGDHAGLYADIFTASQGLTLSAGSLTFGGTISSDRSITSSTPLDFGLDFIDLHHFLVNTGSSMRLIGDTDVVFGVTSGGGMQIGHEAVTIGSASRIINLDATGISLKTGTALTATPKAIYYNDASGYLTELPIGTNGQILTVTSGTPAWETPVGGGLTYAQVKAISFKK